MPVGDVVPVLVLADRLKGEDLGEERLLLWPVPRKGKQESWVLETAGGRDSSPLRIYPFLFISTPWESLEEQPTWYCERVTFPTEAKEPQQPAYSFSFWAV